MVDIPVDGSVVADPAFDALNDPNRQFSIVRETDLEKHPLVQENPDMPDGRRRRNLMRWRVPGKGFVDMFINPQQLQIQERKVIKRTRTKGGYVVQYWGEELPVLNISGTTASAGVEGINILRGVYRAEQNAFERIAQSLADRLGTFTAGAAISSISSMIAEGVSERNLASSISGLTSAAVTSFLGAGQSAPLHPTLASLAVSAELFYQGWVYRGYFESFSVTEGVNIGPGLFEYAMAFVATDMRGYRSNFMPWHRHPADRDETGKFSNYRASDSGAVPPSFREEV